MQNIVALYEDVDMAREVIRQLQEVGVDKHRIDLFVGSDTSAVVSVMVKERMLDKATRILYRHNPVQIDRHDLQWRRDGKNERDRL